MFCVARSVPKTTNIDVLRVDTVFYDPDWFSARRLYSSGGGNRALAFEDIKREPLNAIGMVGWTPSKMEPRPSVPPPAKKGTTTAKAHDERLIDTGATTTRPPPTHYGYPHPAIIASAKKPFVVIKPPEPIEQPPESPREPVPHRSAGYGKSSSA
jgi:hypothetical protein